VAALARNGPRPRRLVQAAAIAIALTIVAFASRAATPHEELPLPPETVHNKATPAGRGMTHLVHHNFKVAGHTAGQRKTRLVLHNFEVVGHSNLRGGIAFADVWAHRTFAYVGSSCGASRGGGGGVRIVDISRPARPRLASSLQNDRFTRAEDVVVRHVRTPSFAGDLAVVGIQACLGSGHENEVQTGLAFFDVSDPAQPRVLSKWLLPLGSIGCHEIDLVQRADGVVLTGCARQAFDQLNRETGAQVSGGVQFVDATDPTHPVLLTSWEMQVSPRAGIGCLPLNFAHSIRFENGGQSAYVSYWDAGTIHLDLADPAAPRVVSGTVIAPRDEDGDNHSMTLANGGRWLVINSEDFSPSQCRNRALGGWGEAHVFERAGSGSPRLLGTFSTSSSRSSRSRGTYTIHNTEVARSRHFFSSWYSGGIVWWTMDTSGRSKELGRFVPPASKMFGVPLVWGVYVDRARDLVLASDFGSGLWVVRPKGLKNL
jgi:hypothetical protein